MGRKLLQHLITRPESASAFLDLPAPIKSGNVSQFVAMEKQLTECADKLAPETFQRALGVVRQARAYFDEDQKGRQLAHELGIALGGIQRAPQKTREWPDSTICAGCWQIFVQIKDFQEAIGRLSDVPALNANRTLGDVLSRNQVASAAIARVCAETRRIAEIDFPSSFAEARYFLWTESVQTASSFPGAIRDQEVLGKCRGY